MAQQPDPAGPWRPESFRERGVALPFTTPFLLGGRIRHGERGGAELVLDHPAKAGCVRILPWSAAPGLCAPTLHDRALWERAAALPVLSPASVRGAARAVATEGFAGRQAARAAEAAEAERRKAKAGLQYGLLLDLLRRIEPAEDAAGASPAPAWQDDFPSVERRAASALRRLCEEGGPPPAAAMAALGEIASAAEGCGPRAGASAARLPRLAEGVLGMAEEMAAAAGRAPEPRRAGLLLLAESAGLALRCARAALGGARALLDDPWALLHRWPEEGPGILERLNRPEWALDGWAAALATWRGAGAPPGCGDTFAEGDVALLVPVLPAEVDGWAGAGTAARMGALREALWRWGHASPPGAPPAAGRLADQTARNEALRAACP